MEVRRDAGVPVPDDLSSLSWVQEELRKTLEAAHKALRRYLRDAESASNSDLDDVDPTVLRNARQQLHQGMGVLELVNVPEGAALLRASEALVQRFVAKPARLDAAGVEAVERASFALLDYLGRRLAGKPADAVALFPQLRPLLEAQSAERVHPADLWPHDFHWRDVPATPSIGRPADAAMVAEFERRLLSLVKPGAAGGAAGAAALRADCYALAAGTASHELQTLWRIAAAFFEAWALGLLPVDLFVKRTASRVLAQLRQQAKGGSDPSERLAADLLFYCARAVPPHEVAAPCLRAVRQAYALPEIEAADYDRPSLGRFDPAQVQQARKRVDAAKQAWSDVAAGESHRLPTLNEPFSLVADSIRRLWPGSVHLADALVATASRTSQRGAPPAELAMEVATALLSLEAALDDGDFDRPDDAARAEHLALRLERVAAGAPAEPLEPWMEELYRRVADKQTLGTVVQELRASLLEVERQIDQYFRNPREAALLVPVPAQLVTMRGVLTVLGVEPAAQAVLRMREDVDQLLQHEPDPHAAAHHALALRLAGNLGALGFLIDMLGVQPQMAKALFVFDAGSGLLSPVMGRHAQAPDFVDRAQAIAEAVQRSDLPLDAVSERLQALSQQPGVTQTPELAARVESAQAALDQAAEAGAGPATEEAVREHIAQAMNDFVATATSPIGLDSLETPVASRPMALDALEGIDEPPPPFVNTGLEDDDEMREVFLEESRDVLAEAHSALAALEQSPGDLGQLTVVRRAFHTLKGSARMVGLRPFGEAAWAGEQLYNHWLATQAPASVELRTFTGDALAYFDRWVEAIDSHREGPFIPEPVMAAADALRLAGELMRVPLPDESPAPFEAAVPPLPVARLGIESLDLELPALDEPAIADGASLSDIPALPEAYEAYKAAGHAQPPDLHPEPVPEPAAEPAAFGAATLPLSKDDLPDLHTLPLTQPLERVDLEIDGEPAAPVLEPLVATQPAPLQEADLPVEPVPVPEVLPLADEAVDFMLDLSPEPPAMPPLELAGEALELPAEPIGATEAVVDLAPEPVPEPVLEPVEEPQVEPVTQAPAELPPEDVKVIGPLQLSIPLFNIFLNEADELSRRLGQELSEWALELHRPVGQAAITQAHSLAGNSATVGFTELCELCRALEHALIRSDALGQGEPADAALFQQVEEDIRRLLHQFAAGFLRSPMPGLVQQLNDWEWAAAQRQAAAAETAAAEPDQPPVDEPPPAVDSPVTEAIESAPADEESAPAAQVSAEPASEPIEAESLPKVRPEPVRLQDTVSVDDLEIDQHDAVDPELFPVFEEEAQELLPRLAEQVRLWTGAPGDLAAGAACMRTLHTFKGGARLAGAMRLGEMAHRFETVVQQLLARERVSSDDLAPLQARLDALTAAFERLCARGAAEAASSDFAALPELPTSDIVALSDAPAALDQPQAAIDWTRFAPRGEAGTGGVDRHALGVQPVRVRIQLLDRLVNMAGEVSISRARLEAEVSQMRAALGDLTDNLERLHQQLHDIGLETETQLQSRREAARAAQQAFDPLELDRYTRVQELTRMMAESVDDVSTVRTVLQRSLQGTEDDLASQGRLTRELQTDLLRTRMVEFDSLSERLYRVVRQAAKETGKQVRLDIVGGSIEVDRSVLDRMTAAFEHLLRNCVTHGIEWSEARHAAGKDPTGSVVVAVEQEGNEVTVEVRDDGAGLDLERIRDRAVAMGLLAPDAAASERELANLIFAPGLSTAGEVTELAGRGVGMDVVRSDVQALGGRVETRTQAGRGTRFRLVLPLTTVVTQVVLLRSGDAVIAVPSNLVELVQRATPLALETAYRQGSYLYGGLQLPFYWLGALLQASPTGSLIGRTLPVVVVRSAQQRVALHVDEVLGTHEVVVKNLGPQLARVPGLAGMTLLVSGAVALIYNPVALAAACGRDAQARMQAGAAAALQAQWDDGVDAGSSEPPLVLVVDDSLTVRRVTQRLLEREGYRVALAKDGMEALETLAGELPMAVLCDIEMPRMDGFDLLRNIRGDARLHELPVIMITSRIAEKHRDHALQLGAQHYLGKPYSEEELLKLLRRYTSPAPAAA